MEKEIAKKKRKLTFPDAYVLIIGLIIFAAILSYIIPAGAYARIEDPISGRTVVQPGTYEQIEQAPVSVIDVTMAVPNGLVKNAVTVFFIFIIGGTFGIVNSTGALHKLIGRVIKKSQHSTKRGEWVVVLLVITFGLAGGVIGMAEECLAFLPIIITLAIGLGYDALVGTSIVMLGVAAGYGAAPINPFTVGLGQSIAGLPMFSGMWFRWIFWVVTMIILCLYLVRYCRKIKADPTRSMVYDVDYSSFKVSEQEQEDMQLTKGHIRILIAFLAGLILLMVLIVVYSLGMKELVAYFFALGLICGIVYGMSPNKMAAAFVEGMQQMVYPAILVGLASGISVIMEQGHVLDTIVYASSQVLNYTPRILDGGFMMIIQSIINFFIPSGTGQAIVTMPLMAPLADVIGIPRQVAVLAYQMGDGFANSIVPTLGMLMAAISIGKISYSRWAKFVLKWLSVQMVVNFIFLIIAVAINLGPF